MWQTSNSLYSAKDNRKVHKSLRDRKIGKIDRWPKLRFGLEISEKDGPGPIRIVCYHEDSCTKNKRMFWVPMLGLV
jgi:hypothetical protein